MIHYVGFFQELEHGDPDGGSLVESVGKGDENVQELMADYLSGGYVIATTGQSAVDILDDRRPRSGTVDVRTDGVWVWSGDLAYYVRKYNVALPAELIARARDHGWECPAPGEEELARVRNDMLPPV
ncbi:hypothetical protein [Streptomyces sp. YIM 98790]|uniref:hypothetical protein n=1 Tax=Streptomyces sp. YIM 98790 TaxID=2689077 RepID=UPI0014073633|nr:hypothetical protein [Streptomyces sp. YIM 98790]